MKHGPAVVHVVFLSVPPAGPGDELPSPPGAAECPAVPGTA